MPGELALVKRTWRFVKTLVVKRLRGFEMAKGRAGARGGNKAGNTIAFQGEPGANSDMACHAAFPTMTTLPCPTFDAAMGAVQAGKAELAIIPVENSIAGRVADLHSLLPHTKLKIVGEHFQRVEHCLVALPGASLKDIKTAKSHVQALSQCRNFLKKHRITPLVHADTAGAAREIAEHRRQERRRHRLVARRPDLRPEGSGQEYRGRRPQHHPHAGLLARGGEDRRRTPGAA